MWNVFSKFNFMNGLSTQKSLEFQRIGIDKAALDKTVYAFDKDYSCSSVRYFQYSFSGCRNLFTTLHKLAISLF